MLDMSAAFSTMPEGAEEHDASLQALIRNALAARRQLEAVKERHKNELEPLQRNYDFLRTRILQGLGSADSITCKGIGTAYRRTIRSVTLSDPAAFQAYVLETGEWDLVDWRPRKTRVCELVGKAVTVPGVKMSSMVDVGLRVDSTQTVKMEL